MPVDKRILSWLSALLVCTSAGCLLSHSIEAGMEDGSVSGFVEVSLGTGHGPCARRQNGEISCWSGNEGTPWESTSYFDDAVQVSVGSAHVCALRSTATIICWGENTYGQLGDGTYTASDVPVPVRGVSDAQQVSAGIQMSCAVDRSGRVWCWGGANTIAQPLRGRPEATIVSGLGETAEVSVGWGFVCARDLDGVVRCWGRNEYGQLGDGTQEHRIAPAPVSGLPPMVALAVGKHHACALAASGAVFCWGLMFPEGPYTLTPTRIPAFDDAQAISSGFLSSCAVRRSGGVVCWGLDLARPSSTGEARTHENPVPLELHAGVTRVAQVSTGTGYCTLGEDGGVACASFLVLSPVGGPFAEVQY